MPQNLPRWIDRLSGLRAYRPTRTRAIGGLAQGTISCTAALLAYLPTLPLGLHEGFWGAITAISVVQTELSATESSARDQFLGAAIGGLISGGIVTIGGAHWAAYAVAVIASMATCWLFNIPSAARLAGSTSTIIALVPHQGSAESMVLWRVAEVGWGVAVAIGTVWIFDRLSRLWSATVHRRGTATH